MRFDSQHPPTLAFAVGLIVIGVLTVWWAFSTRPIKKQRGLRKKLDVLFSDIEGPEQCSRLFLSGIMFVIIGAICMQWAIAPNATPLGFFVGITIWATMFLFAAHRKYRGKP